MSFRVPPQNIEAEQSILGGLLLDNLAWDQVADILVMSDFYKSAHQKIYEAIGILQQKSQPVDLITVSHQLQSKGDMESVGGTGYLADLVNKSIGSANITSYAKIVRDKSILRRMIQISSEIIESAFNDKYSDVDLFIDQSEEKFYQLSQSNQVDGLVSSFEIAKASYDRIHALHQRQSDLIGLSTGFSYLDKMTSGLNGGEFIVIAARPSMGKTAFSLNLVHHLALKEKKTVAFFSLEMSREAVMMRFLALTASLPLGKVRSGKLNKEHWEPLFKAAGDIGDSSLFIDETPGISPIEVRARARRLKARRGLDIIIIDYLQLMDLKQKVENRERAVSEISKSLKSLAKELNVPVIALAQLNRGVEGRAEKRPMLSDLRESGSIEQDADLIMMLYREDYYDKSNTEVVGNAEIIIGKQRNGPTGVIKLRWEEEFGRFRSADYPPPLLETNAPKPPSGEGSPSMSVKFQRLERGRKPKNYAPGAAPLTPSPEDYTDS